MTLPNGYTNKNVIDKFLRLDLGAKEQVNKHLCIFVLLQNKFNFTKKKFWWKNSVKLIFTQYGYCTNKNVIGKFLSLDLGGRWTGFFLNMQVTDLFTWNLHPSQEGLIRYKNVQSTLDSQIKKIKKWWSKTTKIKIFRWRKLQKMLFLETILKLHQSINFKHFLSFPCQKILF